MSSAVNSDDLEIISRQSSEALSLRQKRAKKDTSNTM